MLLDIEVGLTAISRLRFMSQIIAFFIATIVVDGARRELLAQRTR